MQLKNYKSKIGQEGSSMQQADYQCHRPTPWMQESVHASFSVHFQNLNSASSINSFENLEKVA